MQVSDRMPRPEIGRDGRLHVRSHGLDRLLADFGKRAAFIDHATRLTTHAQGAQVLQAFLLRRALYSFQIPPASRAFRESVSNGRPSAAVVNFTHAQIVV